MYNSIQAIGNLLRKYRKNAKISQVKLATESKTIQPFISQMENGEIKNITFQTLQRIFSVLGYNLCLTVRKISKPSKNIPYNTQCFWDIDRKEIKLPENLDFVIERILEYGDIKSIKWLLFTVKRPDIIRVVKKSSNLTKKTANFWASYFGINRREILCLSKQFQRKQRKIWKY